MDPLPPSIYLPVAGTLGLVISTLAGVIRYLYLAKEAERARRELEVEATRARMEATLDTLRTRYERLAIEAARGTALNTEALNASTSAIVRLAQAASASGPAVRGRGSGGGAG